MRKNGFRHRYRSATGNDASTDDEVAYVATVGIVAALIATVFLMHPSIWGVGVIVMALPLGIAAFALSQLLTSRMTSSKRTGIAVTLGAIVFLSTTLLKSDGVWGNFALDLSARWSETVEDRLAAIELDEGGVPASTTGSPVWSHRSKSRFFEPLGGLGPRSTPTLADGVIYAMGAEGDLLALNAASGEMIWKAAVRDLANVSIPMWGFSSSPLVHDEKVIIYAGGKDDKGILALDARTGSLVWAANCGSQSYALPQLLNIHGRELVAILSELGLHLYDPANGNVESMYEWKHDGYRALQPQLVGDDSIFTCISLDDGVSDWKKGRYGKGQALLLAQSDAIVVQTESGEIVLLDASPEAHHELGRVAGPSGKSWNHPVVAGNRLFARSAEEAVCYELTMSDD